MILVSQFRRFLGMTARTGSAIVMTALGGAAAAGNIESAVVPIVAGATSQVTDWSGIYLGGSLGYAFGQDDDVGHRDSSGNFLTTPGTLKPGGANYGLRIGWRRASGPGRFFYAVELGLDGGKIEDSFAAGGYAASVNLKNALSLKLKPGVVNDRGDTLYYGIGGVVRGKFDYAVSGATGGSSIGLDTSFDSTGFVLGIGAERALSDKWSTFAELDYTQYKSKVLTDTGGASTKATPKYTNLRIGLNYRF